MVFTDSPPTKIFFVRVTICQGKEGESGHLSPVAYGHQQGLWRGGSPLPGWQLTSSLWPQLLQGPLPSFPLDSCLKPVAGSCVLHTLAGSSRPPPWGLCMENAFPKEPYGGGGYASGLDSLPIVKTAPVWGTPKLPRGATKRNTNILLINLPHKPTSGSLVAPSPVLGRPHGPNYPRSSMANPRQFPAPS